MVYSSQYGFEFVTNVAEGDDEVSELAERPMRPAEGAVLTKAHSHD